VRGYGHGPAAPTALTARTTSTATSASAARLRLVVIVAEPRGRQAVPETGSLHPAQAQHEHRARPRHRRGTDRAPAVGHRVAVDVALAFAALAVVVTLGVRVGRFSNGFRIVDDATLGPCYAKPRAAEHMHRKNDFRAQHSMCM